MTPPEEEHPRRRRRPRLLAIDVLIPIASAPILAGAVGQITSSHTSPASGYYLGLSLLGIWAGLRYDRREKS
jgi:hypothetical protein